MFMRGRKPEVPQQPTLRSPKVQQRAPALTATDKEAAIFQTISTHVISPLFEQHLPKVLKDARSELLKPTSDEQVGSALLEQLLAALEGRSLGVAAEVATCGV